MRKDNLFPVWMLVAFSQYDVSTFPKGECNPEIEKYHKTTNNPHFDDKASWCSSFVNWAIIKCGINGTNNTLARSWLDWGVAIKEPKFGCVAIFAREGVSVRRGHVGFYINETSNDIFLLGGNQSKKVCVLPYKKELLLGYRWPNKNINRDFKNV